ncbi:unnamed protein product [Moneuplotes crassus]|uniref:Uncharacterized protein n=1 Tax=Euplotes crassus TaxID=5936 RepID=A0AAD1UKE0_EUPCR|nr:unnamed protein product [Moneuplotes crassus]
MNLRHNMTDHSFSANQLSQCFTTRNRNKSSDDENRRNCSLSERQNIRSKIDAVIKKYKIDIPSRQNTACKEISGSRLENESTCEHRVRNKSSRRSSRVDLDQKCTFYNKLERENIRVNSPRQISPNCYKRDDKPEAKMSDLADRIDKVNLTMTNNFESLFKIVVNITTMLRDLSAEVSQVKSSLDQCQTNITFTQDNRERFGSFHKQDSGNKEKSQATIPIAAKVAPDEELSDLWNLPRNVKTKAPQKEESDSDDRIKPSCNFDYEKHLREISSITSVFNLSQTLEKNQEVSRSSRFENPYNTEGIEAKLENLKQIPTESPETSELKVQSERIKSSLSAYLEDRDRKKGMFARSSQKQSECSSPKFMNFLNDDPKIVGAKESTLSSIPSEFGDNENNLCNNTALRRSRVRSKTSCKEREAQVEEKIIKSFSGFN